MSKKKEGESSTNPLDTNYPLFLDFKDKCPGTVKHSQAVADMVESVCQALDLESEVLKTAALYHDVGKMANPGFFSENQKDENDPHEELEPFISFQIITRHVADGVLYLINDPNIPREVIEIVSQHHGTTVTRYFYQKSDESDEGVFRYPCRKPTSLESAILMICDCLEAGSQARYQANKDIVPVEVVKHIVDSLIDDGQLDEVTMKIGDLKKIKEVLIKELEGMFPKRVDYDEVEAGSEEPKRERKKGAKRTHEPF